MMGIDQDGKSLGRDVYSWVTFCIHNSIEIVSFTGMEHKPSNGITKKHKFDINKYI